MIPLYDCPYYSSIWFFHMSCYQLSMFHWNYPYDYPWCAFVPFAIRCFVRIVPFDYPIKVSRLMRSFRLAVSFLFFHFHFSVWFSIWFSILFFYLIFQVANNFSFYSSIWFFHLILPSDSSIWLFHLIIPFDSSKLPITSVWFFHLILSYIYSFHLYSYVYIILFILPFVVPFEYSFWIIHLILQVANSLGFNFPLCYSD